MLTDFQRAEADYLDEDRHRPKPEFFCRSCREPMYGFLCELCGGATASVDEPDYDYSLTEEE